MKIGHPWVRGGLLAAWALLVAMGARAETDEHAAKLKAAYVYNFLKYAEWPRPKIDDPNAPFVFAVVGQNGMRAALMSALAGKTVAGRPIRVRTFADAAALAADPAPGDALYVEVTAQPDWDTICKALAGRPVLTIAEMPGFCDAGGMLNLREQENHVRFEANPAAVKARGLKLSAELLKLATIVNSDKTF